MKSADCLERSEARPHRIEVHLTRSKPGLKPSRIQTVDLNTQLNKAGLKKKEYMHKCKKNNYNTYKILWNLIMV